MIYTTYFANLRKLPEDIIPIAICAKVPTGYTGLQYKKLAPTYNILMTYKENHDEEQYDAAYREQILGKINPDTVFEELSKMADGKDFALVCYEKSADFCHRQLVANWLKESMYDCEEWTPDVLHKNQHNSKAMTM